MINLTRNAERECSLFDMVCRIRFLLVGDPRDETYAALSLAKDRHAYPAAWYELSVEEVYCVYAETFVVAGRGLNVIQHVGGTDGVSRFSLPCWVPDWSTQGELEAFKLTDPLQHISECLAQSPVALGATPGILVAKTRCICLLEEVVDYRQSSANNRDELLRGSLLAMQQFMLKVGSPGVNGASAWSHLCLLLQEASSAHECAQMPFSAREEMLLRMIDHARSTFTPTPFNMTDPSQFDASNSYAIRDGSRLVTLLNMVCGFLEWYTLALATAGEIAVVPFRSLAGDQIVHFKNALALYTLRLNPGSNSYRPIGGTYIESWGKVMSNKPDWETVTLS